MIDKKFKSEKVQRELSEYVLEKYEECADRTFLEAKWTRLWDIYRGFYTKGTYQGRADLDWASAYQAIETLVPRVHQTLFPRRKWFEIVGVEQSDEKQAQLMSAYLRQIFERDVHLRRKMIPALRYCAIFGTIIGKTPYRKESSTVPVKVKKNAGNLFGLFLPDFEDKKIFTFDSIDFESVDIFNFFVADDFIDNIDDQPFVIHKSSEYVDTLYKKEYNEETGEGCYENLDKITSKEERPRAASENKFERMRQGLLGMRSKTSNPALDTIDFIEYQGVYDDEDVAIVVAHDGENNPIVSAEPLNTPDKKKTFVMAKWLDIPGEFWGMSPIERVEKSIYELNDRVNQTMDATSLIINPMYLNTDADIPEGILRSRPGRVISTATDNGLKALHPPVEILAPAYSAIESLISHIQDTTGATRFLGGSAQTPELQRTATGILSIQKEAIGRINLTIQGIEDTLIIPFLRKAYKYAQFYSERKEIVRIVGKQGIEYQEVDPTSILGDYDFRPLGSQSQGAEEIITQQMMNYLNIIATIPGVMQQFDVMKLATKIGEKMLGLEDMDELVLVNNREQEETEKAISENMGAMSGIPPVITTNDNHRLHLEIHEGFLKDERSQAFPRTAEMLSMHIQDHMKYEKGQGSQPMYNAGNGGSQPGQQQGGLPPQEQPRGTNMEDIVQQIAQPSQRGTM